MGVPTIIKQQPLPGIDCRAVAQVMWLYGVNNLRIYTMPDTGILVPGIFNSLFNPFKPAGRAGRFAPFSSHFTIFGNKSLYNCGCR